jgi:hypothetical protein
MGLGHVPGRGRTPTSMLHITINVIEKYAWNGSELTYVPIEEHLADPLTKPAPMISHINGSRHMYMSTTLKICEVCVEGEC